MPSIAENQRSALGFLFLEDEKVGEICGRFTRPLDKEVFNETIIHWYSHFKNDRSAPEDHRRGSCASSAMIQQKISCRDH